MRAIFYYWREFADMAKVIKPMLPHAISIPRVGNMESLKVVNLFVDYRHTLLSNQNFSGEIEHASLIFYYKASNAFYFEREIGLAALVKDELWRYGILHTAIDVKNEREKTASVLFNVPYEIRASLHVTQQNKSKLLQFALKNIAKPHDIDLEVAYDRVSTEFVDELSKLLMRQDNNFLDTG
ncbi:MAG: hypothetical protein H7Z18_00060 [Methylophilaceae bacterium]|nr:hypothetical protein [Methylophilaceae bacterium]